jgi:DHA1 family bicyclomycin/chloramphenicol resistance-like MFS transporter
LRTPPTRLFALVLASIALIGPLALHLFLPAIPGVKASLGLSDSIAQLTFSISLFGMAFATLVYGSLSDRYGRRPTLLGGLFLFLVGTIVALLAETASGLIVGRLIQAVGAGCGVTLVRAIARDAYGPDRLVHVLAYLTMFYTMGPMISPVIGGMIVDTLGWRSVFAFALLAGAVISLAVFFVIHETHRPEQRAGNGSVLRGYGQLFSHLRFDALILQCGFSSATFMVIATASSTIMKDQLNRSSTEYGLYFALFPAGLLLGNVIASKVGARRSIEAMVFAGATLSLCAVIVQSGLLLSGYLSPLTIFLPGILITMAQGISLPYGQAGAIATIPAYAGTAAGLGVFSQHFVAAVFAQFYGFVADGTLAPLVGTMMLTACCSFVAGLIPVLLRNRGAV